MTSTQGPALDGAQNDVALSQRSEAVPQVQKRENTATHFQAGLGNTGLQFTCQAPSWASNSKHTASERVKGCRCCFPPDQMFETACGLIVGLGLDGVGSQQAEKFVRLCGSGVGNMQLSKSKMKTATKLRKGAPLQPEEVQRMQRCVDEAYAPVLGQLFGLSLEDPSTQAGEFAKNEGTEEARAQGGGAEQK
mmetsp:Transcript_61107/g.144204  ORF Transcript_61107/g.144204 Transcript_61107/m.144204 type:complete len:192 (-) Transcript_61107:634-1209(-)